MHAMVITRRKIDDEVVTAFVRNGRLRVTKERRGGIGLPFDEQLALRGDLPQVFDSAVRG